MTKKYTTWRIVQPAPQEFKKKIKGYSEVILDLLYSRLGNEPEELREFFDPSYKKGVYYPFILKDMERAVA